MKEVKIAYTDGSRAYIPMLYQNAALGVTRSIWRSRGYEVTHIPTGHRVGFGVKSKGIAIEFCDALAETFDWNQIEKPEDTLGNPILRRKVLRAARKFGLKIE
jgi:hypothetical protein